MADETTVFQRQVPDHLLVSMLEQVNVGNLNFNVTIFVKGLILTGTVVSFQEYALAFADSSVKALMRGLPLGGQIKPIEFSQAKSDDSTESATGFEDDMPEIETFGNGGQRTTETEYIHIKDLQIVKPSANLTYDYFPYWRIRMSDIEGWTFGKPDENYVIR